jgi:hypothetical protein
MPGLSFKYPASALVGAAAEEVGTKQPLIEKGDRLPDSKNLLYGELNSTDQLTDEYRFEAGAALPIPCRASVTRLIFMKLLGTGILAAIGGMRATNPEAAISCAYAAAVNAVACVHYFFIWAIRAQNFSDQSPYGRFMLRVGRKLSPAQETADNAQKMFAQETSVDGLRHSDWTVRCLLIPYPV